MNYEFITNVTEGCDDGVVTTSRVAEAGQASVEEPCETCHTVKGALGPLRHEANSPQGSKP
jgi:hypothetical protein